MNQLMRVALLATAVVLAGCDFQSLKGNETPGERPQSMTTVLREGAGSLLSSPEDTREIVYLALDTSTGETQEISETLLNESGIYVTPSDFLIVDQMNATGVSIRFSKAEASIATLSQIRQSLPENVESSADGLTEAIGRARQYARDNEGEIVRGVFVTTGDYSENDLRRIRDVAGGLTDVPNLRLYFFGISPDHRLTFANQFSAIPAQVVAASDIDEWRPMIPAFFTPTTGAEQ